METLCCGVVEQYEIFTFRDFIDENSLFHFILSIDIKEKITRMYMFIILKNKRYVFYKFEFLEQNKISLMFL